MSYQQEFGVDDLPGLEGLTPEERYLPVLQLLRRRFLDERRHNTSGPLLDCVAHMLLYLDQPSVLLEVGLGYLVRALAVCRGDAGLGNGRGPAYSPCAIYLDPRRDAPTMLGASLSNRHPMLQLVWGTDGPVRFEEVEANPIIGDLQPAFIELRSRSMVAQRLQYRNAILGLICLDHTEESHEWKPAELTLIDDFCREFLAPLLSYSLQQAQRTPPNGGPNVLTPAELEVVRLAASGLSYGEIARALGKSIRTVDNQLRSAREKLGARNQTDLVRRATTLLLF